MKLLHPLLYTGCLLQLLLGCSSADTKDKSDKEKEAFNGNSGFYQAAEYEPVEAVWLLWPRIQHKKGMSNELVTKAIIEALVPTVKIKLVVANDSLKKVAMQLLPDSLFKNGSIELLDFQYKEFWARDFGPAFLINKDGQKAIADFMFNDWGYADTSDADVRTDEKLDVNIAAYLKLPVISTNLITEGGNHELNSKGTILLCEGVEKQRNPGMTIKQIESEYKRVLMVRKIIWMKQGLRDDDMSTLGPFAGPGNKNFYTVITTNGHVDEFVRFINDTTIMLAWIDKFNRDSPIEKETARRMQINYEILKNETGQDGKPFHIIKMPMPYLVTDKMKPGDGVYDFLENLTYKSGIVFPKGGEINIVAAASYCNFLIANNKVLVAKYYKPGMNKKIELRDKEAQSILQMAFPGKTIIPIDALAVNYGGGGIHCITINEPQIK